MREQVRPIFAQLAHDRAVPALLAIVVQVLIAMPFLGHLVTLSEGPPAHEMMMTLDRAHDPRVPLEPAEPSLLQPQSRGNIAPPTIQIADATRVQDLPPRPDPAHPNAQPSSVSAVSSLVRQQSAQNLVVLLRALVRQDGTIAETALAGSCGVPVLDDLAATFVKAHWKFLPATASGRPIAKWISLEVLVEA